MKLAVGGDHAGFPLKQIVLDAGREAGHEPIDMGTNSAEPVDFPDYSEKVGRAIQSGEAERGEPSGKIVGGVEFQEPNKMRGCSKKFILTTLSG